MTKLHISSKFVRIARPFFLPQSLVMDNISSTHSQQQVQSTTFSNLPSELLVDILEFLDFQTLLRCRQICRLFCTLIESTTSLQYKIELAASGLQDGPPSLVGPADRLKLLRDREKSWNTLTWTNEEEIKMTRGNVWELYGGVFAQNHSENHSLKLWQLPSTYRGIEKRHWSIPLPHFRLRDFGMDPAQDLLVLVETIRNAQSTAGSGCRIHLHTLSTGEPHPLALGTTIVADSFFSHNTLLHCDIRTSADHIGICFFFTQGLRNLGIWNWKTGRLELDLFGFTLESFAFLTEKHVLIGLLCTSKRINRPNLRVIDFKASSCLAGSVEEAEFLCSFRYPKFSSVVSEVIEMTIRSDPSPSWTPNSELKVPFSSATQNRLFVVTLLIIRRGHMHQDTITLFVPSSTLLRHIETDRGVGGRLLKWKEWGPDGTRMIPFLFYQPVWVCNVFGMKAVTFGDDVDPLTITVYDFNQLVLRRALQTEPDSREDAGVEEGDKSAGKLFLHFIETSLPYSKRTRVLDMGEEVDGLLCSEDNLIIVTNSNARLLTF